MGLFNRKKKQNAVQVNEVSPEGSYLHAFSPWFYPHKKTDKFTGTVCLEACLNIIWKGLSNVNFKSLNDNSYVAQGICSFIEANAVVLVNQYIRLGFMCIGYDKDYNYWIFKDNDIKYDRNGRVINKNAVVIYSPQYATDRKPLAVKLFHIVADLNKISGAQDYLTDSLGVFFILSGQDIPLNPAAKQKMLEGMKEKYGIDDTKYQFMLTNNDMKVTKLEPNLDGLKFEERIKEGYKLLCNLLGVPLPLIFDDSSTYNNVSEAKKFFYENTVTYYAEVLLKIARDLLTRTGDFVPKKTITYRIVNVPELNRSIKAACEERDALLDLLVKLKENGVDVSREINAIYEDTKDMLTEQ